MKQINAIVCIKLTGSVAYTVTPTMVPIASRITKHTATLMLTLKVPVSLVLTRLSCLLKVICLGSVRKGYKCVCDASYKTAQNNTRIIYTGSRTLEVDLLTAY